MDPDLKAQSDAVRVDVTAMRLQCPDCGAPVDTVRVIHFPEAAVEAMPCGHQMVPNHWGVEV